MRTSYSGTKLSSKLLHSGKDVFIGPLSKRRFLCYVIPRYMTSCLDLTHVMSVHVRSRNVTQKNFYSEIYLVFVVSRYKVLFRGKNLSGDKSDCSMLLQEFDTEKQSFKLGNTKVKKLIISLLRN